MKITSEDEWTPSDGYTLEDKALFSIKCKKNVLVIAGPGAGKTELLAQKADYLIRTGNCQSPRKILAISFKKDAAENSKRRVVQRCGKSSRNRIDSMTYDAFSKSILDHFRCALPEEMRPPNYYVVNDQNAISAAFQKAITLNSSFYIPDKRDYKKIISSVSIPLIKEDLGTVVWKLLLCGFDGYSATLSFSMISMLSEYIIHTNPKIKRSIQLTYQHIFLDEFQDTTTLQYNLVKQCFLGSASCLTAVGDSKQRIMLWAGARETVFYDFKNDFCAVETRLLMNHRSAPRLVDLQKKMYASLHEPDMDTTASGNWNKDDGAITLLLSDSENSEAHSIALRILYQIRSGIEPNRICILCKQKTKDYTHYIIEELKKLKISSRVEDIYQDNLNEPIVEILIILMKLASDSKYPEEWNFMRSVLLDLWALNLDSDEYSNMQIKLACELRHIFQLKKQVKSLSDFYRLIDEILIFLDYDRIKATFPAYMQEDFLCVVLDNFKKLFWNELEKANFDWSLAIENFEGLHSIPIMTIHKSKGLEYNVVYFVGLEDSAFWNFRHQPDEDRCAFFVALSRAKREVIFTFCHKRNSFQYPIQSHKIINEFYDLLQAPGIATTICKAEDES